MTRSVILPGLLTLFAVCSAAHADDPTSPIAETSNVTSKSNMVVVSEESRDVPAAQTAGSNWDLKGDAPAKSIETETSAASPSAKSYAGSSGAGQSQDGVPFKYVGNSFSCIFHRPSCPFGQCISGHHLRFFARRFMAIDAGYRPCGYCLPQTWTTVRAVVVGHHDDSAPPVPAH